MRYVFIDFETYCELDLKLVDTRCYVRHSSFCVRITAINGVESSISAVNQLLKDDIVFVAHNALFEYEVMLALYLNGSLDTKPDIKQFRCTMVASLYHALPASLEESAKVLNLGEYKSPGGLLISIFSKPPYVDSADKPDKWDLFVKYCEQDTVVCRMVWESLGVNVPNEIWEEWFVSCDINHYGVKVNTDYARKLLIRCNQLIDEAKEIIHFRYGITNPRSRLEVLRTFGLPESTSLAKDNRDSLVAVLGKDFIDAYELVNDAVHAKFEKIIHSNFDDVMYNMFFFYGARTGRFSGRGVQLQNLKRTDATKRIDPFSTNRLDDVVEQIRLCFEARDGKSLCIMDYSAIEARVLAWLANENWVLDVFRSHGKIYEATAARMYNVDIDNVSKEQRQRGKTAVLALGYGGGVNGLLAFDSTIENPSAIVELWRRSNPKIVRFWAECEKAFSHSIRLPYAIWMNGISFCYENGTVVITLPISRRKIFFPKIIVSGNDISYGFVDVSGKMVRRSIYGGLIAQNITQAVARDIIMCALMQMHKERLNVVIHVHDEIVVEIADFEEVNKAYTCMLYPATIYEDLPLKCSFEISDIYNK